MVNRNLVSVVLSMMFTATLFSACSGAKVIPPELAEQIDKSASFSEILASPQSYQGRTILLGGEVLIHRGPADIHGLGDIVHPERLEAILHDGIDQFLEQFRPRVIVWHDSLISLTIL